MFLLATASVLGWRCCFYGGCAAVYGGNSAFLSQIKAATAAIYSDEADVCGGGQHLCMSLLKNGVSSAPKVFHASIQVRFWPSFRYICGLGSGTLLV